MTEYTICLHCDVSAWEYHRDIMVSEAALDERLISLSGAVEHKGFVECMPFDFRLVSGLCTSSIPELSETNVLEINQPLPEYGFPESLSALIPVTESHLEDLRECLFLFNKNKSMTFSVTLSVNNIYKPFLDSDHMVPIEGKKMNIRSFSWNLSSGDNQ